MKLRRLRSSLLCQLLKQGIFRATEMTISEINMVSPRKAHGFLFSVFFLAIEKATVDPDGSSRLRRVAALFNFVCRRRNEFFRWSKKKYRAKINKTWKLKSPGVKWFAAATVADVSKWFEPVYWLQRTAAYAPVLTFDRNKSAPCALAHKHIKSFHDITHILSINIRCIESFKIIRKIVLFLQVTLTKQFFYYYWFWFFVSV